MAINCHDLAANDAPRTSVLIVNWNGRAHLPACLESLASQTFTGFEVLLVDNGSTDDSVDFVKMHYPWVRLIPLGENLGFAAGNNRGLERARGEYIVTLNNDTCVARNWLEVLIETADSRPEVGMIASRICAFDEPDIIDSLGMQVCRDGMSRGRFRGRRWSALDVGEVEDILFPSACAALYRRSMLDEIGFFDEDFFAYAEDTDLGLRGRLAGWGAVLAAEALVRHKYSQTGGSFSPFKVHLVERNHYWVVLKTFPPMLLAALPWSTMVRYVIQFQAVRKGLGTGGEFMESGLRSQIVRALLRGMGEALLGAPRMLAKRRRIMREKRLTMRDLRTLLREHRLGFRELLDYV